MPQFLTITTTHIPGKKQYAWEKCFEGGYVAIGWMNTNFTGWNIDQIVEHIKKYNYPNESSAISSFKNLLRLQIGDIVAVNNVNFGFFGVGRVISGYKFKLHMHDSGGVDPEHHHYSHYREVDWIVKEYLKRKDILISGEKGWRPRGTTGLLEQDLPVYIKRLLGESVSSPKISETKKKFLEIIQPVNLKQLIDNINLLRKDVGHQERAHESLVEDFLVYLGYNKHTDIKYRQARIDISVWDSDKPLLSIEVKKDWSLNWERNITDLKQAYGYSYDKGIRWIIITNGDYYAIFDRSKGLSYAENLIGEFHISQLTKKELSIIESLKKETFGKK